MVKDDPMKCGLYRGLKLLKHTMKVVESLLTYMVGKKVKT